MTEEERYRRADVILAAPLPFCFEVWHIGQLDPNKPLSPRDAELFAFLYRKFVDGKKTVP